MFECKTKTPIPPTIDPKHCSPIGGYGCQVPMPIRGRRQDIDICVADIVAALNAANIVTVASCCGHGKQDADIRLEDGRIIKIKLIPDSLSDKKFFMKDREGEG